MKKPAVNRQLLHLLVSIYNQSIQTYYHFPDVILCGRLRLEREEFLELLRQDFITVSAFDSFGKNYKLSRKGEEFLFSFSFRRRHKQLPFLPAIQSQFPFQEAAN